MLLTNEECTGTAEIDWQRLIFLAGFCMSFITHNGMWCISAFVGVIIWCILHIDDGEINAIMNGEDY
jgi:hypothetical protein